MSDYGTIIGPGAVRFERLLPGPIERVWAYLTEPEKRATWFAGGTMAEAPGETFELFFRHANLSQPGEEAPEAYRQAQDGIGFPVRLLAWQPPRLLRQSFAEETAGPSEVTFELTPEGESVRLVLTHRRLTRAEMINVAGGWHLHLEVLGARLEGRTPPLFWKTHARLEREYAERFAAAEGDREKAAAETPKRQSA